MRRWIRISAFVSISNLEHDAFGRRPLYVNLYLKEMLCVVCTAILTLKSCLLDVVIQPRWMLGSPNGIIQLMA